MSPRFAPVLVASFAVLVVAACTGAASARPTQPSFSPVTPSTPDPTPVPVVTARPTPTATPTQDAGDVEGSTGGPELTIEFPREDLLQVTLEDPAAKAWRLVVAGRAELAQDRWEIVVETNDVGPAITATEIQQGDVVDVVDLSGYVDGTATAGACHATLHVCIDASGFDLPADGNGRLAIRLEMPDPASIPLRIVGGSAGWPSEPFVLGPWTDTEPFPWGEG